MRPDTGTVWFEGKELGRSIFLEKLVKRSSGSKKYRLKCNKCGAQRDYWVSQIMTGSWEVCEHDLD